MLQQMEKGDLFSMKYRTKGGELNIAQDVVCTSINHKNKTINIKHLQSGEFRKVRHILIIEYNKQQVYL